MFYDFISFFLRRLAGVCAEEGGDRGAYCIYGREPERLKVNR